MLIGESLKNVWLRSIGFGLLCTGFLCSCTPTSNMMTDSSSSQASAVSPAGSTISSVTGSTTPLAECNNVSAGGLTGQMSTYYSPSSGQIVPNYIAMNITGLASGLTTTSTAQIQFVGWYEKTAGTKIYNAAPFLFYFMDKLNGSTTPSQPISILNQAAIKNAMTSLSLSSLGITIDQFFNRMMVVIIGVNFQWEAMSVAYYNTAISNTAQSSGDVLLPPFDANPTTFEASYPFSDLYNLHPFISSVSSGLTDANFLASANQICAAMATSGGRIPASVDDDSSRAEGLNSSDLQRLRDTRYLPVGKAQSQNHRGEVRQLGLVGRIWHRVVESLDSPSL